MIVGSRARIRLLARFENLDFMRNILFLLLKNPKSVVDDKRLANAILYQSKPISVGVSINDRLNYIAYIIGKRIKYL